MQPKPKLKYWTESNIRKLITTWFECKCVDDVARKIGFSKKRIYNKITYLRRCGFELPAKYSLRICLKRDEIIKLKELAKKLNTKYKGDEASMEINKRC